MKFSKKTKNWLRPKTNAYPNPANNITNIDMTKTIDTQSSSTLKNSNGLLLHYLQFKPTNPKIQQIDISSYATSFCLLTYFNGENIAVEKIIKK